MIINRLYGSLMLGELLQPNQQLYRFSSYAPPRDMIAALGKLVPRKLEDRALFAEYLIQLLRCSPFWVDYTTTKDPTNTYDLSVVFVDKDEAPPVLPKAENPVTKLVSWASDYVGTNQDFPTSSYDPPLTFATAKLFSALSNG